MGTRLQSVAHRPSWPDCLGTMAGLIRAHQWRVTPLGPIEGWPQSLKTAVELMLHSRQPAWIGWGRALITLYNDATISQLRAKHPDALGKPCAEVWPESWADIRSVIDAVMAGEPQHVVGRRINDPGQSEPASWHTYSWTPLRDDKGHVAGLFCVATETTLQLVDEHLRTVLENTRDAVSMFDLRSNKYIYLSPAASALTGFSAEELHNLSAAVSLERVHPDDRASHTQQLERLQSGADTESVLEYRWRVKSGEYRWFSVSRKLVRDPEGVPVALVGVSRDITERKRAELQVEAGRAKLEAALHSMTDAVFIADSERRFIHINDAFAAFHRYKSMDECPRTFAELAEMLEVVVSDGRVAEPEDWPVARALRGESATSVEYTLRRKDTGETWVGSYSFGPVRDQGGAITGAVVTARDVTARKTAERALRESEARLNLALESGRMGMWEWNPTTGRSIWNSKMYELLGLPLGDGHVEDKTFFQYVHPEDLARFYAGLEHVVQHGQDWRDECRIITPSGELRWLSGVGRVYRNPDGTPRAMLGVNYDISEQRHAEAALRVSERRYRLLHESQRDGFVNVAMNGDIIEFNEIYRQMLGYTTEELRKLTFVDLTPPRWRASEVEIVEKQILPRGYSDVYEKEYRRKDGTTFPVELRTILSRDAAGNPESMWAIVRDISERKAAEVRLQNLKDELIHVGRISELTQVSAGIAHELNQPLAAMLNYSALAKRLIEKKDGSSISKAQDAIEKAGDQAVRAGEIIRRMRDFVEKRDSSRTLQPINEMVEEALALGLIGAKADGVAAHLDLSPDLPPVLANRVQIEQVLVNLLRNAIDAMSHSPTRNLTLATRQTGGAIEVLVADTGTGIPDTVAARLFEPFVTTKQGGMGIGLAISRSIIEAHGGDIGAEPNPAGGAIFRFTLPAVASPSYP